MHKVSVHQEVQELLPWFVNESLDDKERVRVMNHLSECELCRGERDQLQNLQALVQQDDSGDVDYKPSFSKLMDRIEASEANRQSIGEVPVIEPKPKKAIFGVWPAFALAASLAAVTVIWDTGLFSNSESLPAGEYETLTTTRPDPVGQAPDARSLQRRLVLTFDESIPADTLRNAFIETGSYIVSGPDPEGRYLVEMEVPLTMSESEFLDSVQMIEGVQYAAFESSQ